MKKNDNKQCFSNSSVYNTYTESEVDDLIDSLLKSSITSAKKEISECDPSAACKVSCTTSINTNSKKLEAGELLYDMSTNSIYVGDYNGCSHAEGKTTTSSNAYSHAIGCSNTVASSPYSTTAINSGYSLMWTTTASTISIDPTYYDEFKMINSIIEYLKEDELIDLIDKLNERGVEHDLLEKMIRNIINSRHLSEEFILHFIDFIDTKIIKDKYKYEIQSQSYPRLALLVAVE